MEDHEGLQEHNWNYDVTAQRIFKDKLQFKINCGHLLAGLS